MKVKKRTALVKRMDEFPNVLINAAEFIKKRLFFVTLNTKERPKSTPCAHYFSIDNDLTYDSFYSDFGPLNLSMLYHYCVRLKQKLSSTSLHNKKIVHYTGPDNEKRVNAAYLIGSYAIIYLGMEPETVHEILCRNNQTDYIEFRDASVGKAYTISLLECLKAIKRAFHYGFFDFDNFDSLEYEHYERVEKGDLNWIIPNKIIAFCGPHNTSMLDRGYPLHSPETYFQYFRRNKVNTIIRLNKKVYDADRFVRAGFTHIDLYFVDGGTPSNRIMQRFLAACESEKGGVAVHCKAGLGRTGTLIACYIMKHYKFSANEAIAWIRICRPGSVIGHQQCWLQEQESALWKAGDDYRKSKGLNGPIKHCVGIYSLSDSTKSKLDSMSRIMKKVDSMELNDRRDDAPKSEDSLTQGDKLNEIKAQRSKAKPLATNISDFNTNCSRTVLTGSVPASRLMSHLRTVAPATTRVLSKRPFLAKPESDRKSLIPRNETTETPRRFSHRTKATLCLVTPVTEKNNIVDARRQPKVKENVGWFSKTETVIEKSNNDINKVERATKRGKRSLNLEKDKINSRSIKLLRFSPGQTSQNRVAVEISLPVVKLNKTI